jgi:hypothetical protein
MKKTDKLLDITYGLNETDRKILIYYYEYKLTHNISPTMINTRKYFGFKSLTTIQRTLIKAEKLGLASRDKFQHNGWKVDKPPVEKTYLVKKFVELWDEFDDKRTIGYGMDNFLAFIDYLRTKL